MSTLSPQVPPENQIRTSYPTPRIQDLLFFELRDERKAQNAVREYGTPHPTKKDHLLVKIEPAEEAPGWMRWWYAAKRDKQHLYNFEITHPYGGKKEFPRIRRTWIIPRGELERGIVGVDRDPVFENAVLVDHNVGREQQVLDGWFIVYVQIFDLLPSNEAFDAGAVDYGWVARYDCYPDFPIIEWTFDVDPGFELPEYGDDIPIPEFAELNPKPVLSDVRQGRKASAIGTVTLIYEVLPGRGTEVMLKHQDFGEIKRYARKILLDDESEPELPEYGEEFPEESGMFVIDARVEEINCRVGQEQIDVAALPTPVKEVDRNDSDLCDVVERSWFDLKSSATRPSQGDTVDGLVVLDSAIQDTHIDKIARINVSLAVVPSPVRLSYATEQETGGLVATSQQIVMASDTVPTPDPGQDVSQRPIGCNLSIRSISSISVPGSREECATILFDFPAILLAWDYATLTDNNGNEYFPIEPVIRGSYRKKVAARVVIDYHTTHPGCSNLFQLFPNRISYNGILFKFSPGTVINDAIVIDPNTSSSNPKWGVLQEKFEHPASNPSRTEYLALVSNSTEVLIDEKIGPWKFNLFRRERYYIVLE